MYYKLSNTAKREHIEQQFNVAFKYPNLYKPEIVLNGLSETSIPIITMQEPEEVTLAIWGLLPEYFEEDWEVFQDVSNTLNISERDLGSDSWCHSAFEHRRCVILVTGFFTTYLRNGIIFPYHIGFPDNRSFLLAGVYNKLSDGFLTSSFLTGPTNDYIRKFQNLAHTMPVIIPERHREFWLDSTVPAETMKNMIHNLPSSPLQANPIDKDFFKNNITYDSMLNPMDYKDIPLDDSGL